MKLRYIQDIQERYIHSPSEFKDIFKACETGSLSNAQWLIEKENVDIDIRGNIVMSIIPIMKKHHFNMHVKKVFSNC